LPVTGVPLPFVSHGFNSLISVGMAMGLIQSAYRSTRAARARETPARSGADAEGVLVRQAGA
jgi:cell division protein FtsW